MTTIRVTQEHINSGKQKCGTACAIALALALAVNEHTPQGWGCYVGKGWVEIHNINGALVGTKDSSGNDKYSQDLPPWAQHFIRNFEAGDPVVPFEFELQLPTCQS